MKKLKLEDLLVVSFATAEAQASRGTVEARADTENTCVNLSCDYNCQTHMVFHGCTTAMCAPSFDPAAASCAASCAGTCQASCANT
ncbi:hypothetical protein, partial [Longimicrobium sp.]|uniref:hypothetical protein n=1 Tax=Longimicrobium sp. TaxID=2029185 RepID=UPI002E319CE0